MNEWSTPERDGETGPVGPPDLTLSHCILIEDFSPHAETAWKSVDIGFELRKAALFYQGVLIPDADLLSSPAFVQLSAGGPDQKLLREGFESGFLRPLRRRDSAGNVASQRELFERLRERNPVIAAGIDADHPKRLDRFLDGCERRHRFEPVIWDLAKVTQAFADRLIYDLVPLTEPDLKDPTERAATAHLSMTIRDDVLKLVVGERVAELSAAVLLQRFLDPEALLAIGGRRRGRYPTAKARVQRVVLGAYGGNVPAALGNRVMLRSNKRRRIPTGPETELDLRLLLTSEPAAAGAGDLADAIDLADLDARWTGNRQEWWIDRGMLESASLTRLIALRGQHPSATTSFFDLRFASLGSPIAMTSVKERLMDAAAIYHELLAEAGYLKPVRAMRSAATPLELSRVLTRGMVRDAVLMTVLLSLDVYLETRLPGAEGLRAATFLLSGLDAWRIATAVTRMVMLQRGAQGGPLTEAVRRYAAAGRDWTRSVEIVERPDYGFFARYREAAIGSSGAVA